MNTKTINTPVTQETSVNIHVRTGTDDYETPIDKHIIQTCLQFEEEIQNREYVQTNNSHSNHSPSYFVETYFSHSSNPECRYGIIEVFPRFVVKVKNNERLRN
jgi:hypothetical protein